MSFPRYPKYKDSGVEWLGEVPEHWAVGPVKRVIRRIESGTSVNASDEPAVAGRIGVLKTSCVYTGAFDADENKTVIDEEIGRVSCPLKAGTLIVSRMNTPDLIGAAGFVAEARENIFLPDRLWQISFTNADPRFVHFWTLTDFYRGQVQAVCTGTSASMKNLGQDQFGSFTFAAAPVCEQTQIAEFLDRETAKIDELVAEQRRLIELLKEKRQAVISHAVTKGLNPTAPLRPSGIEWLGDVPEHWVVKPLRSIANVVRGASPRPAGDPRYFGGDVMPWVTVAEITKDDRVELTDTESFLTEEGVEHSKLFPSGTVIYSNSGATLGVPKILRIDACANDGVVAFERLSDQVHPQFLYHYLASITDAIREKVKQGSGQPNLNTDIVKALQFGVPPLDEQEAIVLHIEQLANQFGSLTAEAQHAIELLQERRTALISAAVTGKIDVRGFANQEALV